MKRIGLQGFILIFQSFKCPVNAIIIVKSQIIFLVGFIQVLRKQRGGERGSVNCLHWLTGGTGGVRNGPKMAYVILEWPLILSKLASVQVQSFDN